MGHTANVLRRLRNGSALIALLAAIGLAVSFYVDFGPAQPILMGIVASMCAILVAIHVIAIGLRLVAEHRMRIIIGFLEHDSAPGFCTDDGGVIFAQNRAATERFGDRNGASMTRALNTLFANPEAVVSRLQISVQGQNTTREDVVTRRGHVRVAIHSIPGGHLWRLEDIVDKPSRAADGVGLPILTFGASGTILFMNDALREVVGKRVKRLRDLFEEVPLESGALNRMQTKDGTRPVRLVLSETVNNRQEAFVLPAGEAADGRVGLDVLPVALLRLDPEGAVVSANRAARDLLPASVGDGDARLSTMVEGLGRSVREWIAEAASGRGLYRPEVVRVTDAQEETFLQITLSRPLDGDGGLIAVLNDATELKTMEAQFVQSQKMQAIGQLAGGVAHDFNNLLTAISGHCDLLLLRHDEADEDYADLIQITQNANRAAALVGQLLAFSRKQTLEMQQVDLRDTLGDLTHLLNRLVGERTELRLDHDPALIPIRGDRRQLEQVLMNLVVNARDAMPDGGTILVETRCRYLERPLTRDRATVPPGQFVVVSVTDEGCGIPRDSLTRIFEPFFTTKRPGEGTGLGLSMVYGIVKQSGGFIFCDSTVGKGTQFSLFFPADLDAMDSANRDGTDAILAPALRAITAADTVAPAMVHPADAPPLKLPVAEEDAQNAVHAATAPDGFKGQDQPAIPADDAARDDPPETVAMPEAPREPSVAISPPIPGAGPEVDGLLASISRISWDIPSEVTPPRSVDQTPSPEAAEDTATPPPDETPNDPGAGHMPADAPSDAATAEPAPEDAVRALLDAAEGGSRDRAQDIQATDPAAVSEAEAWDGTTSDHIAPEPSTDHDQDDTPNPADESDDRNARRDDRSDASLDPDGIAQPDPARDGTRDGVEAPVRFDPDAGAGPPMPADVRNDPSVPSPAPEPREPLEARPPVAATPAPVSPAESLIRDAERLAEESTRKPIVLLVEDEAPVRAFASRALRLRGCTVLEAANAEDALEALSDLDLKVDLFVTDVMMPGMDGPSWVREALKARPDVRTVFMSGYTQDALSDTSAPVPNAVFLPKPFSLSDLTRTVERALA